MASITVMKAQQLGLPEKVLKESHIRPEADVVVVTSDGRISLLEAKQVMREGMERVDREMRHRLREAIKTAGGQVFAGLTLDQYLALTEQEDKTLWDRLYHQAEQEVKTVERDIPSRFRPPGQKRRARGASRHRSR